MTTKSTLKHFENWPFAV